MAKSKGKKAAAASGDAEAATEAVRRITLGEFGVTDTSVPPQPTKDPIERFRSKLKVRVVKKQGYDLEFDLVGVDPSVANAIRRLLITDVPSMAIEKVYMYNNTSIIQDEVRWHVFFLLYWPFTIEIQ